MQGIPLSPSLKPFSVIVAASKSNGIGNKGEIPWPRLPKDMEHLVHVTTSLEPFALTEQETTTQGVFFQSVLAEKRQPNFRKQGVRNALVMGRKTWESIPPKFRPLKNRVNCILSSSDNFAPKEQDENGSIRVFQSFEDCLSSLSHDKLINEIFIFGGQALYELALGKFAHLCKLIFLTRISKEFECDTFLPAIKEDTFQTLTISKTYSHEDIAFDFAIMGNAKLLQERRELIPTRVLQSHPPHEEMQYLSIIKDVIENGKFKDDRTGVGTYSKFGYQMRFDLAQSFPLLTTKDVFWRGVAEELIWFVGGNTNAKLLSDKKIRIWDGNASREFLDKNGLFDREEWDLGPVYGFQWRHFGAQYTTMHEDYSAKGIDQLADVINKLKNKPNERRILMTAWNVADLSKMALPPCHILAQFYVSADQALSCQMYQRSCDMGLGVPFNIASYALLTCMLAQVTGLKRGEFIHCLGDTHVYSNHVEPLKEQLKRYPYPFPQLKLNEDVKEIDKFTFQDLKILNYRHHPKIKMDMAV